MRLKRIVKNGTIVLYGLIMTSGMLFSLTPFARRGLPFVPRALTVFAYGTIAPYQGYASESFDWGVSGLSENGTWEAIDTSAYEPFIRGEGIYRHFRMLFRFEGTDAELKAHFERLADQIRKLEAARGKTYGPIRFEWWEWPISPEGYDALKREPFLKKTFVTDVP